MQIRSINYSLHFENVKIQDTKTLFILERI